MKGNSFVILLTLFALLIVLGCTQQTVNGNDYNLPYGADSFSDMPPFDPNAVCPYECCKDNDERYYGKKCTQNGSECIDHACVVAEIPTETPITLTLEKNELYPGVFFRIIGHYETALALNEYNGYPQYGPIGLYQLGPNEEGDSFDYNSEEKVVVVEIELENRSFDGNYNRMEQTFEEALRFYIVDGMGREYMEDLSPPREEEPLYNYFNETQTVELGTKENAYVAFRVPNNDYVYTKLIVKQNQDDQYLTILRTEEFDLN